MVTETNAAPPGVRLADSERDTMLFVRAIPCWYGVSGLQAWAVRSGRVREWQLLTRMMQYAAPDSTSSMRTRIAGVFIVF